MDSDVRKRLRWVRLFDELKNCTKVCLKCGISRPTLRKWLERYQQGGLDGLVAESRRPDTSPSTRISDREREWIAQLRARGLGLRRIQSELKRSHDFEVSRPTIEKVLKVCEPLPRVVRPPARKVSKRYAKEIPGERIQMDPCTIAPGLYQYTAIDDCTRSACSLSSIAAPQPTRFNSSNSPSRSSRFLFSAYRRSAAANSSPTASRKS